MNILHISRSMGIGGAQKVVYQLCSLNCDYRVFVASSGGENVQLLEDKGVQHFFIPDMEDKKPSTVIRTLIILNKVITKEHIDIIHTHHRMAAVYGRLLKLVNKNIKHIYTAHNVFYGKKQIMRFALRDADIVACGDTVRKNLISEYKISEDRISVIYNSVDEPKQQKTNIQILNIFDPGRYYIGCVGRLTYQKGVDIFVKAVANIVKKYPKVTAVIVGDGDERNKIEEIVNDLEIQENILFLGYQSAVFEIIENVRFIVLSSRWEGFPLLPIEAFAVGKPVIASDIENNMEIVKNNYNGLSFISEDVESLTTSIEKLIKNETLLLELGRNALKTYKEKFSFHVFISKYCEEYRRMMKF